MKYLFVLFSLLLLNTDLTAQTTFIRSQDWESIKQNAQSRQKLIFIDAYTDWCGWCKVMDKKTFSNPAIGNMMDQHFINVKLEMEKDELGKQLALKYAISSFPSYLIFNEKGELIYQTVGYQEPGAFMNTLFAIITPGNHIQRPGYSPGFDITYPDFYLKAMGMTRKKKFPAAEDVNAWVSTNHDLSLEANWTVYQRFYFHFHASNREHFWRQRSLIDSLYGHDLANDIAASFLYMDAKDLVAENDSARLDSLIEVRLPMLDKPDETAYSVRLYYAKETQNWKDVNRLLSQRFKEKGMDDALWWNEQCWDIYENANDSLLVEQALIWIAAVVKTDPDYNHLDTYAALLFKAGSLDDAALKAKEAIEKGIATNKNVEATEALLLKIEAAKVAREAGKSGSE